MLTRQQAAALQAVEEAAKEPAAPAPCRCRGATGSNKALADSRYGCSQLRSAYCRRCQPCVDTDLVQVCGLFHPCWVCDGCLIKASVWVLLLRECSTPLRRRPATRPTHKVPPPSCVIASVTTRVDVRLPCACTVIQLHSMRDVCVNHRTPL